MKINLRMKCIKEKNMVNKGLRIILLNFRLERLKGLLEVEGLSRKRRNFKG